jgi:hypothetical protein
MSYVALATTTLTGNQQTVTFSSIPNTFKDLVFVVNSRTSQLTNTGLRFNSDSGSNYFSVEMVGTEGGAATSGTNTSGTSVQSRFGGGIINSGSISIYQIMDYAATDKQKTVLARHNWPGQAVNAVASRWANTSVITSLSISTNEPTFTSGATFSLYGIA